MQPVYIISKSCPWCRWPQLPVAVYGTSCSHDKHLQLNHSDPRRLLFQVNINVHLHSTTHQDTSTSLCTRCKLFNALLSKVTESVQSKLSSPWRFHDTWSTPSTSGSSLEIPKVSSNKHIHAVTATGWDDIKHDASACVCQILRCWDKLKARFFRLASRCWACTCRKCSSSSLNWIFATRGRSSPFFFLVFLVTEKTEARKWV